MLNFAIGESNVIRSLAHDLFIELLIYWRKCGIEMKIMDSSNTSNIPSSDLVKVMIDALFELAFFSHQLQLQNTAIDEHSNSEQVIRRCSVPIAELIMTVYLFGFPCSTSNPVNSIKNSNYLDSENMQEDEEISQVQAMA